MQFAETDLAGIVHFSCYFRYMEEAEHALWRAAGMTIESAGSDSGWPRVAAAFEYKQPLHFEDEFEDVIRIAVIGRRSIRYEHTFVRGATVVGTGTITTVHVRKQAGASMKAAEIPEDIIGRLMAVLRGPHG